jgi:magnesium-transporting ATPase (P-type)
VVGVKKYLKSGGMVLLAVLAPLFSAVGAGAEIVNIQPQAPPGLGEKLEMFLGWIYWIAIVASVAGVIVGAVMIWAGRDNGRQLLIGALIALAILATLGQLLGAIGL